MDLNERMTKSEIEIAIALLIAIALAFGGLALLDCAGYTKLKWEGLADIVPAGVLCIALILLVASWITAPFLSIFILVHQIIFWIMVFVKRIRHKEQKINLKRHCIVFVLSIPLLIYAVEGLRILYYSMGV